LPCRRGLVLFHYSDDGGEQSDQIGRCTKGAILINVSPHS
jgi:hypothetical protein